LDATEGSVAKEPTEDKGSLEAKTIERFAPKTQHVPTQDPEVLPEESEDTRRQVAIFGVISRQHREDTATQQAAEQKGARVRGPAGEAEHQNRSAGESGSQYREVPQGERSSSR